MATAKLRIPARLVVVVITTTMLGCPSGPSVDARLADGGTSLCPATWYCTTDAARALNCEDGVDGRFNVITDAGTCEAPI